MTRSLTDLGQQLLDAAKRAGADACDAMAVDGISHSIEVRAGKLEQAERSEGVDIGLRVFVGARQACVSASDTSPDTIPATRSTWCRSTHCKGGGSNGFRCARMRRRDPYV